MKSKLYLLIGGFIIIASGINAQTPTWNWSEKVGNSGDEIGWGSSTDNDGNRFLIGSFSSASLVIGSTTLTNAGSSTSDIFLVKYDSVGSVQWAKSYGTPNSDEGRCITVDDSGYVYITGYFNGASMAMGSFTLTNNGFDDIFIAKLNPSGTVVWATSVGNVGDNRPGGIIIDINDLVVILGGYANSSLTIGSNTLTNAGNFDFFVAQFNSTTGQPVYAQGFGGTGRDDAQTIALNKQAGYYYIGGRFDSPTLSLGSITLTNSNTASYNGFAFEYNNSLAVSWANSYAASQVNGLSHYGSSNTLYVCGEYSDSLFIVATDTLENSNPGTTDAFVLSSSNNVHNWAMSFGGNDNDAAYGLATSSDNKTAMSGVFTSSEISFGSTDLANANTGTNDLFIAGISSTGSADWALRAGNIGDDFAYGIHASSKNEIYVSGWYEAPSITFGSLPVLSNSGGIDAFIARLEGTGTGINDFSTNDYFTVYPNPSSGLFNFTNVENRKLLLQVYNSNAQLIFEKSSAENMINIDLHDQSIGIYYYRFSGENYLKTGKLLKH